MNSKKLTPSLLNDKKLLLTFIFLISLLTSSVFLLFLGNLGPLQHNIPGNDYLSFYEPVANNILQGKGISLNGQLDLRYPPGYPVILAGIFSLAHFLGINELVLIVVFNVIVAAGTACFLFLISELIFGRKVALVSSFLWLSYPLWLWFLKNPNTEVPFILLLYAGIWLYVLAIKEKRLGVIFLSGVILGLDSLIRPIGLLLPFILAGVVFLLLKENSKKLCFLLVLVILIGNLMAILPWEIYVFSRIGRVIPLSNSGPTAIVDGLIFAVKPGAGGDQAIFSEDIMALMERAKAENLTTFSKISHFLAQEVIHNPFTLVKLIGWKMARSWYATSQMWWEGKILLGQLIYLVPGFLGIIYVFKKYKDKFSFIVFLLSIVLYFWLMTVLALSILRYMIPAMGLLIIFSAVTVALLIDKIKPFHKTNQSYG